MSRKGLYISQLDFRRSRSSVMCNGRRPSFIHIRWYSLRAFVRKAVILILISNEYFEHFKWRCGQRDQVEGSKSDSDFGANASIVSAVKPSVTIGQGWCCICAKRAVCMLSEIWGLQYGSDVDASKDVLCYLETTAEYSRGYGKCVLWKVSTCLSVYKWYVIINRFVTKELVAKQYSQFNDWS